MKNISIFLSVLIAGLLIFGCGASSEKKEEVKTTAKVEEVKPELQKAHGATMNAVLTSDELYNCSMHPDIVSDHPALCPLCGSMELVEMDSTQIANLRNNNPVGCPMCPVATAGGDEKRNCPMCKMDLVAITDKAAETKGHEGHGH